MSGLEYFLSVKTFNRPFDISHLLLKLGTDWECSVHSYFLTLEGDESDAKVMRLNCNAIEFDRNIKHLTFLRL